MMSTTAELTGGAGFQKKEIPPNTFYCSRVANIMVDKSSNLKAYSKPCIALPVVDYPAQYTIQYYSSAKCSYSTVVSSLTYAVGAASPGSQQSMQYWFWRRSILDK